MIEPSDELLQKAADAANKITGLDPDDEDVDLARKSLCAPIRDRLDDIMGAWGLLVKGYLAAHEDMVKDNV